MAFTTDLGTAVGKVRLLITDLDAASPIYPDDAQIQVFLDMESSDIKMAAALALESIAANRVFTMKVIQILDLKVDGYQVAKGLMEAAKRLRDTSDSDWAGIDFAEVTDDSYFVMREKYWKLLVAQE